MEREELIKKWLDHNLSQDELSAFMQLNDYGDLIKMDRTLKNFKAPEFSVDDNYTALKEQFIAKPRASQSWYKPLLRIAAVLVLGLSIYYYSTTLGTSFNTKIAQHTEIRLPDASFVTLNANSTLNFNKNHWTKERTVNLNGEAFFKVAKGEKFDVVTTDGIVSVLGTQFNVKQRKNYFEVTCFEGLVAVTHKENTIKLKPGYTFQIIDGKLLANEKEIAAQPNWLRGESSFVGVPLKYVIAEFENYYNYKIIVDNIDTNRLFTGSFTHGSLDLALRSITIPLNLSYSKSKSSIVLKRE